MSIVAHALSREDIPPDTRLRFIAKIDYQGEHACWPWLGSTTAQGYGHFRIKGKSTTAHRASVALFGRTVPAGMTVDHLCRNPSCVNPAHLDVVTHEENLRRAKTGACAVNRQKAHCPEAHEYTDYTHPKTGRTQRVCWTCRRKQGRENARRYRNSDPARFRV